MATLVRDRADIEHGVPAPFPVHLLDDDDGRDVASSPSQAVQASVAAVQHACLMVLAGVLSPATSARADDAERLPLEQVLAESPLACLVRALRSHDDPPDRPLPDAALLPRLRELVDAVAPSLHARDAELARTIASLLLDLDQLPASLVLASARPVSPDQNETGAGHPSDAPYATIASLQRHLSSLKPAPASAPGRTPSPADSIRAALLWVRVDEQLDSVVSLCRARAHDHLTEPSPSRSVEPSESQDPRPSFDDALPPDYDSEYHHFELPPSYVADGHLGASTEDKQADQTRSALQYPPEKAPSTSVFPQDAESTTVRDHAVSSSSPDLDTITHAIERLHVVAPQLENQRVELRRDKITQMERAKEGKGKARVLADSADPELDKMLELLGRASAMEIPDQSVVIDPYRTRREKGTVDLEEQRKSYLEHLVRRTHAGRLHSQDAIPSLNHAHSSAGDVAQVIDDQNLGVQLEERGSREGKRASYSAVPKPGSTLEPPTERLRNRSLSAPHLAWLKPKDRSGNATGAKEGLSLSRSPSSAAPKSVRSFSGRLRAGSKSRPSSADGVVESYGALDIAYVAEHHETLKHILLFIAYASPSGSAPGGVPSAEVLPSTSSGAHGDCLFLRLGGTPSPPLALPVPVLPGPKTVLNRSGHWEVKASCYQGGASSKDSQDVALLPASELAALSPLSYVCASCSLPLVPAPSLRYRDLPSEHWEELVDAWMCHPEEQTLAKSGMLGNSGNGKGSNFGFWPTLDEALVGGSYVLFDGNAVAGGNIKCVGVRERGGNARLARCLCGAILGRQHDRRQEDGSVSRMYRLFKYAIRPISAVSQVPKIPMSAFVLHDMLEHVQAHATYRFVLSDEEEERPRLLIWLFKPRIRISYMLPAPALLPKSGTIDASKILYKIVGPTSDTSDFKQILDKYPGFPQAEYMFYPMDVCRKLAALLKESSASYPENMRTMTGLDVGWLTMM